MSGERITLDNSLFIGEKFNGGEWWKMPKTAKSYVKQKDSLLPLVVNPTGSSDDVANLNGGIIATVPLPNDVIITSIEGEYTEMDRKLFAFLVFSVWEELGQKPIQEIRVSKILKAFNDVTGGNNESTDWIWKSVKRLNKTQIVWTTDRENPEDYEEIASLIAYAKTQKEFRKTGVLYFQIVQALCELIKRPRQFSRLRMHFLMGLSGKYAVSLYMLLETVANLQNPIMDIELAKLRNALKVPEGKLDRWVDIKRFVLEPALNQINAKPELSGFTVTMEAIKEGRSFERVRFIVNKSLERVTDEERLKGYGRLKETLKTNHLVLSPSVMEKAKEIAMQSGWDVYYLEQEWREYMANQEPPENAAGSFIGFVKKKAQRRP